MCMGSSYMSLRTAIVTSIQCHRPVSPSLPTLPSHRAARFFSQTRHRPRENQPTSASKRSHDTKLVQYILDNVEQYKKNCIERNYISQGQSIQSLGQLFKQWRQRQVEVKFLKEKVNALRHHDRRSRNVSREEIDELKSSINTKEVQEEILYTQVSDLVNALPNLTSPETPRQEQRILRTSAHPKPTQNSLRDHVEIGRQFGLINFEEAAATSGWGSYHLRAEAVELEEALVRYAHTTARQYGFTLDKPPTMVYSDIVSACGYQPRDRSNEQQVYNIAQDEANKKKPFSLAGTAEIPFAGMKANKYIKYSDLPLKVAGPSICYRAEAGAHGQKSRGLYRVHEFTKVEMFAWTTPEREMEVFDTMLKIQMEILDGLGLHYRVLEMPSGDLGASAYRKQDIEVFFPSRNAIDDGWGEVTSTSMCTDYQCRRLNTRITGSSKAEDKPALTWPSTVNGTAVAIPRVLAALLEYGLRDDGEEIMIPKALQDYWRCGKGGESIRKSSRKGTNV